MKLECATTQRYTPKTYYINYSCFTSICDLLILPCTCQWQLIRTNDHMGRKNIVFVAPRKSYSCTPSHARWSWVSARRGGLGHGLIHLALIHQFPTPRQCLGCSDERDSSLDSWNLTMEWIPWRIQARLLAVRSSCVTYVFADAAIVRRFRDSWDWLGTKCLNTCRRSRNTEHR
jgi:hypothetical protein